MATGRRENGILETQKCRGCPESDALRPQCVWFGRQGGRRDQETGREKMQRNQSAASSVHSEGLELHPMHSEQGLSGKGKCHRSVVSSSLQSHGL